MHLENNAFKLNDCSIICFVLYNFEIMHAWRFAKAC